jgi:plastocyanin
MRTSLTRSLAAVAAGLLVLGLAACGDDDDSDTGTDEDAAVTTTEAPEDEGTADDGGDGGSAEGLTITAADNSYDPTSVTATPGQEVVLANSGSNPHTITADDGSFDSGTVSGGAEGEFAAPNVPGTYTFHCEIHPSAMQGVLTVA